MPVSFKSIPLTKLHNYEHYQFYARLRSIITPRTAYVPQMVREFFNTVFLIAFATLDEGIKKIIKSAFTREIWAADRARDEIFAGMVNIVNAALTHFDTAMREKALRLKVLFDTYGNLAKRPLDAETAAITNFLQDLNGPVYAADAAALGLTEWAAFLNTHNYQVSNMLASRENEAIGRPNVDIKAARAAVDDAYKLLTPAIEMYIALGVNVTEAVEIVETFNLVIDRFNKRINRRKGKPGGGTEEEDVDVEDLDGDVDGQEGGSGE